MEMKLNNITITLHDGKEIISNLSLVINKNDKLGIIGEEGNGKSTLLKFLVDPKLIDSYCYYSGNVNLGNNKIGYLIQSMEEYNNVPCVDYLLMDETNEINYELYNEFNRITNLANRFCLDMTAIDENRLIGQLSGGEKVKLQLIKIFFYNSNILLLDEPTNDLDLSTMMELEKFIKSTSIPVVFISHDYEFLKNTANKILHIEQINDKTKVIYNYMNCGFEEYLKIRNRNFEIQDQKAYHEKKEIKEKQERLNSIKQKVEHQLNLAVRDPSLGRLLAKKMKNIKSKEKQYQKEDENRTLHSSKEEDINISFESDLQEIHPNKVILNLENYDVKINDKILSTGINLHVKGAEHIAIVGNNGVGKTTFIKSIVPIIKNVSNIKMGYFSQKYEETLSFEDNVIDYLTKDLGTENIYREKVMTYLSSLNFLEYEFKLKIKELSGGQKAKVMILKFILDKCNVLILDEPTRNLSPLSCPKICKLLSEFKGTIISISHDRNYIRTVCDKVYEFTNDGLILINNNEEF